MGMATGSVALALSPLEAAAAGRTISTLFQHFLDQPAAPFGDLVSGAIFNYNRMSPNLGTAGVLREGGLEEAVELGFKTIIDLRGPSENGVSEEAANASRIGVKRIHIPITTKIVAQEQINQFTAALDDPANYPILTHCASANRVGGMWVLYRVGHGIDPILAIEEARGCGLKSREAPVRQMLGLPPV